MLFSVLSQCKKRQSQTTRTPAAISAASPGRVSRAASAFTRPFGKALTEQPDGTDDKAEAENRRRQPEEQERSIKAGDAAEAPRPQQLIARVSLRCAEKKGQPQRIT